MRRYIWILLISFGGYAQQTMSLPEVFESIAVQHGVRFSYIAEELAMYRLTPPDAKLSLSSKLAYIRNHTRLKIDAVNSNYYTVYNDKRMDKPLCGFLIDGQTRTPVENAAISMPHLGVITSSDANGYFELPVKPHIIRIAHMSYSTRELDPQELYLPDCPVIELRVIVQELSEISAQRYLATGISKSSLGSVLVRPERFGILPGLTEPDILQTMQQLPGVTSVDETISNINVRGGTHDQNLFAWNGIRMFQTGHFFGLISAFNPMLSTQIKISRNGTSAFLGESVSSAVELSSHGKIAEGCYHSASVDMINANFYSKVKLSDRATILAAGRRTYTDLIQTPTFNAYTDRIFQNNVVTDLANGQVLPITADQKFYFYDLALQYHQVLGKHELIIDAIGVENKVDFYQGNGFAQKNSFLAQRNFGASIGVDSRWNEQNDSKIKAYFSWYDLRGHNQTEQQIDQQNRVFDKGISLRHGLSVSSVLKVDLGYQFDEVSVQNLDEADLPPFFRERIEVSRSHALMAEAHYARTDEKLRVRLGLRNNYFEKFGVILEPRLAADYVLFPGLNIELLAESKSQTLSQIIDFQQDFLGIEKRRWILANGEDIPVQQSRQASFGMTYRRNRWLVSLDNFYKDVEGISSKSQGFTNQYEFVNTAGSYRVLGSELLVQKSFTKFYSWISYSFNDNRYDFDDLVPGDFPNNFTISHSVSWAGIYEWRLLRIALGAKWHTGAPYTIPVGYTINANPAQSSVLYGEPNAQHLDDFFQLNLSASHKWDLGERTTVSANLSLWNLLDTKNKISQYYRINPSANLPESVETYALGFTPNMGLRINF